MSGTYVQSISGNQGFGTSLILTLTGVAAGNLLACIQSDSTGSTTDAHGPTTPAGASSAVPEQLVATSADRGERFDYYANIAGGSTSITFTTAGTSTFASSVIEASGCKTTLPLGTTSTGTGSASLTATAGAGFTPTAGSFMVVAAVDTGVADTTVDSIGSSFTMLAGNTGGSVYLGASDPVRLGAAYLNNAPASATNPTVTFPSAINSRVQMVEFLAAAAAAAIPPGLGPAEQMDMYTMSAVAAMMR